MDIDQREYNVAKQNGRIIHTKINILNFDFQIVDEISGVVLDGSTYNIDATSDIRRTCNISLIPKDRTFNVEYGGKLWMDKYIQVFIGIEDITHNNEINNRLLYIADSGAEKVFVYQYDASGEKFVPYLEFGTPTRALFRNRKFEPTNY